MTAEFPKKKKEKPFGKWNRIDANIMNSKSSERYAELCKSIYCMLMYIEYEMPDLVIANDSIGKSIDSSWKWISLRRIFITDGVMPCLVLIDLLGIETTQYKKKVDVFIS